MKRHVTRLVVRSDIWRQAQVLVVIDEDALFLAMSVRQEWYKQALHYFYYHHADWSTKARRSSESNQRHTLVEPGFRLAAILQRYYALQLVQPRTCRLVRFPTATKRCIFACFRDAHHEGSANLGFHRFTPARFFFASLTAIDNIRDPTDSSLGFVQPFLAGRIFTLRFSHSRRPER